MKRRKKIEQKVGKIPVHLPASRNSMSAIVALLAYTYHTEKRIEKLLGKPMKALVRMPVLRNGLALTMPNGAPQTHVAVVPPTQKGVDEVLQACRDALHAKSDR